MMSILHIKACVQAYDFSYVFFFLNNRKWLTQEMIIGAVTTIVKRNLGQDKS